MKTTFYLGENDEHKVDVILQKFGKELVYVDDILSVLGSPVHDLRYYKIIVTDFPTGNHLQQI